MLSEAHRLRRKVTAHAHGTEGIAVAVEAGVDMIEHCSFTTPGGMELADDVANAMAARGIVVSPTVSIGYRSWPDDGRRERRAQVMRGLLARGCGIIMSTDCGIPGVPHTALADGMEVLSGLADIGAVETLKLATSTSASILGLKDRGTIEPGKAADLLIVEGDPTVNLPDLKRVRYVFKDGLIAFSRRESQVPWSK